MKSDIEIQLESKLNKITEVAKELDLKEDDLECYGSYKAKINDSILNKENHNGKIILCTAITPTKAGEGKTTVSIGLAEALRVLKKNVCLALREPSLGPVMGLKGGATGGGYSQVLPMDDINLHFTGDMHALTSANNLISAVIDNEIHFNSELNIDPERVLWRRCLDVNDRNLRQVTVGLGPKSNGVERPDEFRITVASEMMAILCLSKDIKDLENRLNRVLIAYSKDGKEIFLKDLAITGSLLLLLKDAIKPNLVQTNENGPAIIHGGPFANIAHGCNSVIATSYAKHLSDYVVTEAGFGADLGFEKYMDIKARMSGLYPSCVVLVVTIRALKMHGGVLYEDLKEENVEAMLSGLPNMERHVNTIKTYNLPFVIAINRFYTDTDKEVEELSKYLENKGYRYAVSCAHKDGGKGAINLAEAVIDEASKNDKQVELAYELTDSIEDKIFKVASKVYGASAVEYTDEAKAKIDSLRDKYSNLCICMAKTQNSVTDDAKVLGAPTGFTIHVRDVSLSNGAGFIVVYTGKIITMPGLPQDPACKHMGLDENGKPYGIF